MSGAEREKMSCAGKVVCVTGASGYVASYLVKLLLDRGYTVKETVRNLSDPKKVVHLKALEGAKERLQLFEAELLEDGSFDSAVDGCEGVFHTATPCLLSYDDPQGEENHREYQRLDEPIAFPRVMHPDRSSIK